jgi:hypothetical protein
MTAKASTAAARRIDPARVQGLGDLADKESPR